METKNLTLGEKIKLIRKAQGITMSELADSVHVDKGRFSRIENNIDTCHPGILADVRRILKIEGMPLFDNERESFETRMHAWRDLINEDKTEEADALQEELSAITRLPFEHDYIALFNLFKVMQLLGTDKKAVQELISDVKSYLENASDKVLYCYYYLIGSINYQETKYEAAFSYYLKAYKLKHRWYTDHYWLYFYLASAANKIGWLIHSIKYAQEARAKYKSSKFSKFNWFINNLLALNYIGLSFFDKAKERLNGCFTEAKRENNNEYIGYAYVNYSYLYCRQKDWHTAISYSNMALKIVTQGTQDHFEAIYQRARALVGLGDRSECQRLLNDAKKLAKDDECYSVQFRALECLLTLRDDSSIDYLVETAIPYFIKSFPDAATILDFCELLMEEFNRPHTSHQKKAHYISAVMNEVYKNMTGRGELK